LGEEELVLTAVERGGYSPIPRRDARAGEREFHLQKIRISMFSNQRDYPLIIDIIGMKSTETINSVRRRTKIIIVDARFFMIHLPRNKAILSRMNKEFNCTARQIQSLECDSYS